MIFWYGFNPYIPKFIVQTDKIRYFTYLTRESFRTVLSGVTRVYIKCPHYEPKKRKLTGTWSVIKKKTNSPVLVVETAESLHTSFFGCQNVLNFLSLLLTDCPLASPFAKGVLMKRIILPFSCILVLMLCVCSAPNYGDLTTVAPEKVGLSGERLARMDALVQKYVDDGKIAGAVTLVARHGTIAHLKATGMMDREAAKPMRTDTIFRIASMTKPITSLAVMMLYEEGRFLLSDPVSRYIPEFRDMRVLAPEARNTEATPSSTTVPANREITIRDLLTHTSGITYQWNPALGKMYHDAGITHGLVQDDGTIGDDVRALARIPLLFQPGGEFHYGINIDVLGYFVEVVSGMTLDEFFRTRIFEPLGMNDTFFYAPEDKAGRLATVYMFNEKDGLRRFPDEPVVEGSFVYSADYPYKGPRTYFSGGGGLCSTAGDYARFCQMMLNGGELDGVRLVSRKTVEFMTTDHLGKISSETAFGLGFGIEGVKTPLSELTSPGRYGWGGFWSTHFFIDPKEDMLGVFMVQLHPADGVTLNNILEVLAYQAVSD